MGIKELDKRLEDALSVYACDVQEELTSYKELSDTDQAMYFIETLDEMNQSNYYAMQQMRESIVDYLKGKE